MKAAAFDYCAPSSLREAAAVLADNPEGKILAGGQTLGPMLNLRLSQPSLLIDIARVEEAKTFAETAAAVTYGACITHADFEDGRVPDPTGGFIARVARGIAYRAVRTRGTLGGSLAYADPAADWLSALSVLDVEIKLQGPSYERSLPLRHFIKGALTTALVPGEVLASITISVPPSGARFGYAKICRKTGEFAEAIGAVRHNGNELVFAAGACGGAPIVITEGADFVPDGRIDRDRLAQRLIDEGLDNDPYLCAIHVAALQRALDECWKA